MISFPVDILKAPLELVQSKEFLTLLISFLGFAILTGWKSLAKALFHITILAVLAVPFISSNMLELPSWVLLIIGVFVCLGFIRLLAYPFIGRGADAMVGTLAAGFIQALLFFPRMLSRFIIPR